MASTILTNWTVYYADDAAAGAGYKQIKWTGGATGTNTLNELYSELMHLFDNASQNDANDSIPMRAVTPTQYEIGSFDAGDKEPWYIDPVSIQHLTGGGLNTVDWTYVSGSEAGIFKIPLSSLGTVVAGDVGAGVTTSAGSMTGTLLHVDTINTEIYIRPTSSSATHDWSTVSSGTITVNGHTCTQNAAGTTGENIYANIYTIGSIRSNTEIYVTQSDTLLTQWWDTGHIDILVLVSDQGSLIDGGLLRIFARQYSTLYDNFETTVATGGRNPVPLATSDDINNNTGYSLLNCSVGSGTFVVGEVIGNNATQSSATALGIITNVAGTTADPDLTVYLVGDLTAFTGTDTVYSYSTSAQADVDTVSNTGPAATGPAAITATFAGVQKDLGNGFGNAWYSVVIDGNGETISSVYERLKYITRRGYTSTLDSHGTPQTIPGEQYQGIGELYIPFDTGSVSDPFTKGNTLTVTGTNFTGTITAKHNRAANQGFLIVRDYTGTLPVDGNTLSDGTHTALVDDDAGADPVETIAPVKQSPFGTFAGGKFFGARGVWIENINAGDSNNYQLIDSEGNTQIPPATVSTVITVRDVDTSSLIENAIVLVWATDNANYFYQASVSITGSGTTATVTHTSHGLITGDDVIIQGVTNDDNYNGAFQVTVTGANTYTYTTNETVVSSPATGTPVSTFAFINGLTNASGVISDTRTLTANQPIAGRVRKSTSAPYYKESIISGTVSSSGGFSVTVQMVSDE